MQRKGHTRVLLKIAPPPPEPHTERDTPYLKGGFTALKLFPVEPRIYLVGRSGAPCRPHAQRAGKAFRHGLEGFNTSLAPDEAFTKEKKKKRGTFNPRCLPANVTQMCSQSINVKLAQRWNKKAFLSHPIQDSGWCTGLSRCLLARIATRGQQAGRMELDSIQSTVVVFSPVTIDSRLRS